MSRARPTYTLPPIAGPIAPTHAGDPPLAHWAGDAPNLLDAAFRWPTRDEGLPAATPLAIWSGWISDEDDPAPGPPQTSPRTWMPAARATLEQRLIEARNMGLTLALRPHASHVISDVPGVLDLTRRHAHVRVLLDPCAMLTGDMLSRAHDHVRRILGDLAPLTDPLAALLAVVMPEPPPRDFLALLDELVPPHIPLVGGAPGAR